MADITSTKRKLESMSNEKLMDVYRNGQYYGYSEEIINHANSVLETRGIHQQEILIGSKDRTRENDQVLEIKTAYVRLSIAALIAYCIVLGLTFFDVFAWLYPMMYLGLYLISFIAFIACLIGSAVRLTQFFKAVNQPDSTSEVILYIVVGLPLFFFVFIYFLQRMNSIINRSVTKN